MIDVIVTELSFFCKDICIQDSNYQDYIAYTDSFGGIQPTYNICRDTTHMYKQHKSYPTFSMQDKFHQYQRCNYLFGKQSKHKQCYNI